MSKDNIIPTRISPFKWIVATVSIAVVKINVRYAPIFFYFFYSFESRFSHLAIVKYAKIRNFYKFGGRRGLP